MNIHKAFLLFFSFCLILTSCVRTPGEGGRASIIGSIETVRRVQINNPESTVDTIPAMDAEVFIVYGDNVSPDDRAFTNPDGDYAFNWLRSGEYTIYVYSEDASTTSTPLPKVAVSETITIEDNDDVVEAPLLTIYDNF